MVTLRIWAVGALREYKEHILEQVDENGYDKSREFQDTQYEENRGPHAWGKMSASSSFLLPALLGEHGFRVWTSGEVSVLSAQSCGDLHSKPGWSHLPPVLFFSCIERVELECL